MNQKIEIISLHFMPNDGGRIKGFADVQLGDLTIREFRILAEWNGLKVVPPRVSWRGTDGEIKFKTVITLPHDIRKRVETLILKRFEEECKGAEKKRTT